MLDIKNIPVENINQNRTMNARFVRMKNQMDVKMASYLRYLGTKNAVNRASDYHYLCLAVTDSTAPVNGIDYIHPSVKPVVDYATAVVAKGLMPNGEINFEFVADTEDDEIAARMKENDAIALEVFAILEEAAYSNALNANASLFRAMSGSSANVFTLNSQETITSDYVFVRPRSSEYNYSENPSFISGSTGEVLYPQFINNPQTYITTIGLYNDTNDLLAVAKLSRPLTKDFTKEALVRVKLDF
jgi:hypothetical protein